MTLYPVFQYILLVIGTKTEEITDQEWHSGYPMLFVFQWLEQGLDGTLMTHSCSLHCKSQLHKLLWSVKGQQSIYRNQQWPVESSQDIINTVCTLLLIVCQFRCSLVPGLPLQSNISKPADHCIWTDFLTALLILEK